MESANFIFLQYWHLCTAASNKQVVGCNKRNIVSTCCSTVQVKESICLLKILFIMSDRILSNTCYICSIVIGRWQISDVLSASAWFTGIFVCVIVAFRVLYILLNPNSIMFSTDVLTSMHHFCLLSIFLSISSCCTFIRTGMDEPVGSG